MSQSRGRGGSRNVSENRDGETVSQKQDEAFPISNGMNPQENIPLAPFTTLGVGGIARFFIEAKSEEDIRGAVAFARDNAWPLFVLGAGSNVLVPDDGVAGVVLKLAIGDISVAEGETAVEIIAGAAARWDDVVDAAGTCRVFGVENLAGIPGSVAGAVVQNIGAYGAELSTVFSYADCIDAKDGSSHRITLPEAEFAYRTSIFKNRREFIIVRVALTLSKSATANLSYGDVAQAHADGVPLRTPQEIARAIRAIRAKKFPSGEGGEGTAGSFFKNPVISAEEARVLTERFPGLPAYTQSNGAVKVSLAWLLDHALALKGYAVGPVRLYEKQPLVIVAKSGATAADVESLAREVVESVLSATGVHVEREVETFGVR